MFTYIATNTLNGKFYVGSTRDFSKRKSQHLRSKHSTPFHNSLRKNPDNFVWGVFEDDSDEPVLEQALLDQWFGKGQCYNLCPFAGRPQYNAESVRQWGLLNGSTAGNRTFKDRVGIFDPNAPKEEWNRKGGERTKERYSKPVRIVSPDGEEYVFSSVKEAIESDLIPYTSLRRCLNNPGRTLRSGFAANYL